MILGHKTEAISRRYTIADAGVLREAAARIDLPQAHSRAHRRLRPAGLTVPCQPDRDFPRKSRADGGNRTARPMTDVKSSASASSVTLARSRRLHPVNDLRRLLLGIGAVFGRLPGVCPVGRIA